MVVQAYILIQTDVGKAAEVAREIAQVSGVTLAEDVTGPYDVIVRAEAKNVDDGERRGVVPRARGASYRPLWGNRASAIALHSSSSEVRQTGFPARRYQ